MKNLNRNIRNKRYSIDENYFDNIDNQEKAYFLGFLYSDGYNNTDKGEIVLNLQERDEEILIKFKNLLKYSGKLYYLKPILNKVTGKYSQKIVRFYVSNKYLSSKLEGLDFNIKIEDIIIPDKCPLLDKEFIKGVKGDYQFTHSIDRIDSNKGYIKGNIQVLSMKANNMKSDSSQEELITFAINILKQHPDHKLVKQFLN